MANRDNKSGSLNEFFLKSVHKGRYLRARLALLFGADINGQDEQGRTALMLAAASSYSGGYRKIFDFLLRSKKLKIELRDNRGRTALFHCWSWSHAELLLNLGANIDACDNEGATAFFAPYTIGSERHLKVFLDRGVDVNQTDNSGRTVLMRIAQSRLSDYNLDDLVYLCSKGADVNRKDRNGYTALMYATENYKLKMAPFLLTRGANVHARNNDGETALMISMHGSHALDFLELYLAEGADISARDTKGHTAFLRAARYKYAETKLLKALIARGADVNDRNSDGKTALMLNYEVEKSEVFDYLLTVCPINAQDAFGNTLLMIAANDANFEKVKQLVAAGADMDIRNRLGKTAMMLALRHFEKDRDAFLLSKGIDPKKPIKRSWLEQEGIRYEIVVDKKTGQETLGIRFPCVRNEIIKYLVRQGASPNIQDNDGNTILHLAALNMQYFLGIDLIQHGADGSILNNQGYNTFFYL